MDENNDFSMFSTGRLKELKNLAAQLRFWDDVAEYDKELARRENS